MASALSAAITTIPSRIQLAGGWIDQPFVSRHDPNPPGSMVVVQVEPGFAPMARSGFANSTRAVAMKLWGGRIPSRPRDQLVRELYLEENKNKRDPSGSQDMIGLVYPGVNRLDYDYRVHGGVFPFHIELCNLPNVARWLERVLNFIPVGSRPAGYNPLGQKNLNPEWIGQLGQSGRACFEAIVQMDLTALGASFNLTMKCWETLLPHVVRHPMLKEDLPEQLAAFQRRYPGAMYSGCGGGYLIVVSEDPVPGACHINVRVAGT